MTVVMAQRQQAAEQFWQEWDGDEQEDVLWRDGERASIVGALGEAAALLESEPDAAAALLDGVIVRIGMLGLPQRMRRPDPARLLTALDACAPALARQLRLALRAPGVGARYVHAAECLRMLGRP